jgi:hypothetical protein
VRNGGDEYQIITVNVTRLLLRETDHAAKIRIDGKELGVTSAPEITLEKSGANWRQVVSNAGAYLKLTHCRDLSTTPSSIPSC